MMGRIRKLQPNAISSGYQDSFNTISSYNTIYNTNSADEENRILRWLSPLEPRVRHQDVSDRRKDGLGSWFLRNEEFVRWRSSKNESGKATLFCSGDPGVGKTYLSSLVIDTLHDEPEGNNVAVAYLYCDFQDLMEQTPANLIGALVKQLVRALGKVPEEVDRAFHWADRTGEGLLLSNILDFSKATLAPFERIFICIDALDECPDKVLSEVLSSLRAISQGSPGVRLFFTGRPHVQGLVEKYFPDRAHDIPISTDSADIREYLAKELDQDSIPEAMDPMLEAEIMHLIPERISGTYVGTITISIVPSHD